MRNRGLLSGRSSERVRQRIHASKGGKAVSRGCWQEEAGGREFYSAIWDP